MFDFDEVVDRKGTICAIVFILSGAHDVFRSGFP